MRFRLPTPKNKSWRYYLTLKILVGLIGLFLSVALHEMLHIVLHWNDIPKIGLFQNQESIVQILVWIPNEYDLSGEEIAAYAITVTVLIITIIFISGISDTEDTRTAGEILFPDDKEMQKMNPVDMLELADRANMHQIIHAPDHEEKPKTNTR